MFNYSGIKLQGANEVVVGKDAAQMFSFVYHKISLLRLQFMSKALKKMVLHH